MKTFLQGVGVGVIIGYVFYGDIDKIVRRGLHEANKAVDETPKDATDPQAKQGNPWTPETPETES